MLSLITAMVMCALAGVGPEEAVARPANEDVAVVRYETTSVDGLKIFYREAGEKDAPVILLLHGFPSSSRMWDAILPELGKKYHVVAPDYPGFGHSDAPDPQKFAYTFEHLARVMEQFAEQMGFTRYTLFMQDYGGPVGFRMAVRHPERVQAMLIQNAVVHEEGLSPLWETRRAFWRDRKNNEAALRANFLSSTSVRQRHVGNDPHPEFLNPDTWMDENVFLNRPGEAEIQLDLFYDYQTNVASYPAWQKYLRERQPATLVVWGKYDPSFTVEGARAYAKDVPKAEIHILDAGHFALDQKAREISALVEEFMTRLGAK